MSVVVKTELTMASTASATTVMLMSHSNSPVNPVLKKTYNVILQHGESHPDWTVVRCEELHVNTQGKTEE